VKPPKPADPRTVRLKMVRLSFTDSLKEKKATVENGTPKHGCNLIIVQTPGDDPLSKAAAKHVRGEQAKPSVNGIKAAGLEEFNKPRGRLEGHRRGQSPKRLCYRKGERFKNNDGEVYKGYAGNWAISASGPKGGEHRPLLLDRYKREVEENDILDVMAGGLCRRRRFLLRHRQGRQRECSPPWKPSGRARKASASAADRARFRASDDSFDDLEDGRFALRHPAGGKRDRDDFDAIG
jgi:hypothetical protein